jgi:hypothetical protein
MCLVVDRLEGDIRSWLSPPDPWKNYNIACDSRYAGTARWFLESDAFSEWKVSETSSLLWINGKRARSSSLSVFTELMVFFIVAGAGKSVLWYVPLSIFLSQ